MNKTLLLSLLALPLPLVTPGGCEAHADPVSDRVYLTTTGSTACGTNGKGFTRTIQQPDGSWTPVSGEFTVPQNMYLEITSVEYTTPYWTAWAKEYTQTLNVSIKQRVGTYSTSVLNATYMNQTIYGESAGVFEAIGEIVSPGAQTRIASYPVAPLMSSAGRLCVAPNVRDFWTYSGNSVVRGRLIPSGVIVASPVTNSL